MWRCSIRDVVKRETLWERRAFDRFRRCRSAEERSNGEIPCRFLCSYERSHEPVGCERSEAARRCSAAFTPEDTLRQSRHVQLPKVFTPWYHVMSVQAFTRTQHITPRCSSLLLHPFSPRKRHRVKWVALSRLVLVLSITRSQQTTNTRPKRYTAAMLISCFCDSHPRECPRSQRHCQLCPSRPMPNDCGMTL
jgi:hypothetical protein